MKKDRLGPFLLVALLTSLATCSQESPGTQASPDTQAIPDTPKDAWDLGLLLAIECLDFGFNS